MKGYRFSKDYKYLQSLLDAGQEIIAARRSNLFVIKQKGITIEFKHPYGGTVISRHQLISECKDKHIKFLKPDISKCTKGSTI